MKSYAFWISPRGKWLQIDRSEHGSFLRNHWKDFGITRQQLKDIIYSMDDSETVADALQEEVLKRGWMSIRYVKGDVYVSVNRFDKRRKEHLWDWIIEQYENGYLKGNYNIYIIEQSTGIDEKYTVDDIISGKHF